MFGHLVPNHLNAPLVHSRTWSCESPLTIWTSSSEVAWRVLLSHRASEEGPCYCFKTIQYFRLLIEFETASTCPPHSLIEVEEIAQEHTRKSGCTEANKG